MPSKSKKQHNFMAAVAHSPEFAKKAGVPQSVGKEFNKADKGKTFKRGGEMANTSRMNRLEELGRVNAEKARTPKGKANLMAEKTRIVGELKAPKKMAMGGMASQAPTAAKVGAAMDPKKAAMIAQAMKNRPAMAGGASVPKVGPAPTGMKAGGFVKSADGIAKRGKTKATQVKMAKGGSTKKYC